MVQQSQGDAPREAGKEEIWKALGVRERRKLGLCPESSVVL